MSISGAIHIENTAVTSSITPFDVSDLSTGEYMLRVYKQGKVHAIKKFVK